MSSGLKASLFFLSSLAVSALMSFPAYAGHIVLREGFENPAISQVANSNGNWATFYAGESFVGDGGNTWSVDAGSIDLDVGGWNPDAGVQSVDMNGWSGGSLSTTLTLLPGDYDISFAFARGPFTPNPAGLNVSWNGALLGGSTLWSSNEVLPDNPSWIGQVGWQYHVTWDLLTFRVTSTNERNVLQFVSQIPTGPHGTLIDSIQITAVPTPGTGFLFIFGLAGLIHSRTRFGVSSYLAHFRR